MSLVDKIKFELSCVSPTRGVATILGMSLTSWGFWTINPAYNTFTNPLYAVMRDIAPEATWGVAFLTVGALLLYAVFTKNPFRIRIATFAGFILWLILSVCYAIADFAATPVVTTFCVGLLHAWIYLQADLHPETISGESLHPRGWQKE